MTRSLRDRLARWLAPDLAERADRASQCVEIIDAVCFSTPNTGLSTPEDGAYVRGAMLRSAQVREMLTEGWNGNRGAVVEAERDRIRLEATRRRMGEEASQ